MAAAAGPPPAGAAAARPQPRLGARAARFHQKKILEWGRPAQGGGAAIEDVGGRTSHVTAKVYFRWDKTPSFSSAQNIRLQRVLEVASNRLLSEKVRHQI